MARGPSRTVRQRQRPRAHHGAARRRRRVDKPVPRPDQRAEIMQADGEDTPRTGRARTLRHRHARQLAVRAMASMGRMEGAKRVRRRRGMGCVGRQREKPARHGGRRLNDAAPACRPDRGGVRQGIAQRGRVHTPPYTGKASPSTPGCAGEPPKTRSPTPARWSATGSRGAARTGGRNGSTPSSSATTCD